MGKIYPQQEPNLCGSMSSKICKRETYTVWMKSLVFHSNGCTVYDSNGDIVYRVDNYDRKGTREVNLMDLRGTVLCAMHKRILGFGCWDGFRCSSRNSRRQEKRWFQVKKCHKMLKGKVACEMRVGSQKYCIVRMGAKAAFGIINIDGQIVAEVKQKQSSSGVLLGDDVVTMDVEANTDHSLMMAFVTVYGLICGRM